MEGPPSPAIQADQAGSISAVFRSALLCRPFIRHLIFSGVTCGGIKRWNEFIDRSSF